jgi:type II secretory pathway component GspD/PulD (secretin)
LQILVRDRQTVVIGGLISDSTDNTESSVPFISDIPVLGNFFRSKSLQKTNSELMVLCTAHRISPSTQPPPLPVTPKPYMDKEQFDGKKPAVDNKK